MPTVRPMKAWHTDVVEITWERYGIDGRPERLVERHSVPPDATWEEARTTQVPDTAEGQGEQ